MYRHGGLLLDRSRIESIQEHESTVCTLYVKMISGTQHILKCGSVEVMRELVEELLQN